MTSYIKLKEEIVELMKAKEKTKLDVLRLVASKVEKVGDKSDEGVLTAIKSELKEMNQTLESIQSKKVDQNQADARAAALSEKIGVSVSAVNQEEGKLADIEAQKAKIAYLETFLPPRMSNEDIRTIVKDVVSNLGEGANMTDVMRGFKEELAYNKLDVDMGEVARIALEEIKK